MRTLAAALVGVGVPVLLLGLFGHALSRSALEPGPNVPPSRREVARRFKRDMGRIAPWLIKLGLLTLACGVIVAVLA